nr:MAG TPA: hypothetical protein [Caudoviricetes sp.]
MTALDFIFERILPPPVFSDSKSKVFDKRCLMLLNIL